MEQIKIFLGSYSHLWESDFNRGYICGVTLILLIVLLMLVIKVWWTLVFRTRKCKSIIVPVPDGDVVVSLEAVTDTVRSALKSYPLLIVNDVKLYRTGSKGYWLELRSGLDVSSPDAFPDELPKIKQHIFDALKSTFGITGVKKIRVRLNRVSGEKAESAQPGTAVAGIPADTGSTQE